MKSKSTVSRTKTTSNKTKPRAEEAASVNDTAPPKHECAKYMDTMVDGSEVTRTGQAVRSGRFMQTRVIALVEHPAEEPQAPSRRGKTARNQSSLL